MEATLLQPPQKKKKSKNKFKPDVPDEALAAAVEDCLQSPTDEQARRASGHFASTSTAQPEQDRGPHLMKEGVASRAASRDRRTASRMTHLLHANGGVVRHGKQPMVAHQQAAGSASGLKNRQTALQQQPPPQAGTAAPERPKPAPTQAHQPHLAGMGKAGSRQQSQKEASSGEGLASQPPEDQAGVMPHKRRKGKHVTVGEADATPDVQAAEGNLQAAAVVLPTSIAEPLKGGAISANWAALKAMMGVGRGTNKRRRPAGLASTTTGDEQPLAKRPEAVGNVEGLTPVLALDCEMVGVGPEGSRSTLARVCVVNNAGVVLLDSHVAQRERVTDFRTRFSGVRPSDLVGAPPLEQVAAQVAAMFKGRTIVGHAITNDLTALLLSHPRRFIRDTARYPPLMRATAPGRRPKPRALRHLALEHLGLTIQEGEHSPVDDARAALYLYHKHRKDWELHIKQGTISQLKAPGRQAAQTSGGKAKKTLVELAAADDMVDL